MSEKHFADDPGLNLFLDLLWRLGEMSKLIGVRRIQIGCGVLMFGFFLLLVILACCGLASLFGM